MQVDNLLRAFQMTLHDRPSACVRLTGCVRRAKAATGEPIHTPCWDDRLIVDPVCKELRELLDTGQVSIADVAGCFHALELYATSKPWTMSRIGEHRRQWAASKGYHSPASSPTESDPNGIDAHAPGAKLDAGKNRCALVINGFSRALWQVSLVGTFGAAKYTPNGWKEVENGIERYSDAMDRHLLMEASGEEFDPDSKLLHAAHAAWNALARLELILKGRAND
jgi:hypothetical protein